LVKLSIKEILEPILLSVIPSLHHSQDHILIFSLNYSAKFFSLLEISFCTRFNLNIHLNIEMLLDLFKTQSYLFSLRLLFLSRLIQKVEI